MTDFIEGENRTQATLFPERLDDYITEDNAVRVIDVFIDGIDLSNLGFKTVPAVTGRPAYHPASMLKLNDRAQLKNVSELAKAAIASDELSVVADRGYYNCNEIKACDDAGITIYLPKCQTSSNQAKGLFGKRDFIYQTETDEYACPGGERAIYRFTGTEKGKTIKRYWSSACPGCSMKFRCTTGVNRRISRWEHEEVLDAVESRINQQPERMAARRNTVEHPFGTLKMWMGYTHFQTRTLEHVSAEMSLHVLSYNLKRTIKMMGIPALLEAIQA